MKNITLSVEKVLGFIPQEKINSCADAVAKAQAALEDGTGKGNDFLGWLHLPSSITDADLKDLEDTAKGLRESCEAVVVAGIGGSYLGAKAVIEALQSSFQWLKEKKGPVILFAGNNISEDYLAELLDLLKGKKFGIINISKSGTTTETALTFRLLKTLLEQQVGKDEARKRIVAITDSSKGALRKLSTQEGYKTFVIPDNVGGRFSVLTPVGLLPIAVAGFDIRALVAGAVEMENKCANSVKFEENPAAVYAATRNLLYKDGKKIEILVNYHPKLHFLAEWWKQLYGESEGKDNKALYPSSVIFSTDRHSLGQYIQEGLRTMFETVVSFKHASDSVIIPDDPHNIDGLNFLSGKDLSDVNRMAMTGTLFAHNDGGVPNLVIEVEDRSAASFGYLVYFFELACAVSGYMLGVNPFDQPGVEAYKKNMYALLGKPGFEEQKKALEARMQ